MHLQIHKLGGSLGKARGKSARARLLDLGLFEGDVLASNGVVLAEADLLGRGARILLGKVVKARARGAEELDFLCNRLGHVIQYRSSAFIVLRGTLSASYPLSRQQAARGNQVAVKVPAARVVEWDWHSGCRQRTGG